MIPVSRSLRAAALAAGLALVSLPGVARAQGDTSQRVAAASSLPRLASDLRDEGVPAAEVKLALEEMRTAQVPPSDAVRVLREEYEARLKDRSPSIKLDVLVREQLRKGVRGQALADAIKAARSVKRTPAPRNQ